MLIYLSFSFINFLFGSVWSTKLVVMFRVYVMHFVSYADYDIIIF